MGSRLDLQMKLEEILGSEKVYYQPPESLKMSYPAIRYSLSGIEKKSANNSAYILSNCYDVVLIDPKPDNPVIKDLLRMQTCSLGRPYVADNLYHYPFKIYY